MKVIFILLLFANFCSAQTYHFVSIDGLIEQEIGRIIVPEIYAKLGIGITITPLPGKRAQFEATSGLRDGEIMRIYSYGSENPSVIRVPTPFYTLETMAFIRKDSNVTLNNKSELKNYKIVKVRGVKHTNNITDGHNNLVDLNSTKQIMMFLNKNRADIALTNTVDGMMAIKKLKLDNIVPISQPLATLDLFHYVHKKNKHLVEPINDAIKEMQSNGRLQQLIQDAEVAVIDNKR